MPIDFLLSLAVGTHIITCQHDCETEAQEVDRNIDRWYLANYLPFLEILFMMLNNLLATYSL